MSAEAMGWVFRRSPYRGSAFSVHLAIADVVNDTYGNEFWLSLRQLAAKARVSPSSASRAVETLCTDGFLVPLQAPEPALCKPGRYQFVCPDVTVVFQAEAHPDPVPSPNTLFHHGTPPCSTMEHPVPPWNAKKNSRGTQESKDSKTTSVPTEPRADAAKVAGVKEAVAHFAEECTSQGKPSLLLKRQVLGSHVKRALAAGSKQEQVTEALTQAVRESRPLRFLEILGSIENREASREQEAKERAVRDAAAAEARRRVEALFRPTIGRGGQVESVGDILRGGLA